MNIYTSYETNITMLRLLKRCIFCILEMIISNFTPATKFIIFYYSSYTLLIHTTMYTLTLTKIISGVKRAIMDWYLNGMVTITGKLIAMASGLFTDIFRVSVILTVNTILNFHVLGTSLNVNAEVSCTISYHSPSFYHQQTSLTVYFQREKIYFLTSQINCIPTNWL